METLITVKKIEQDWILIFEFTWELDETNADKTFTDIYTSIWDFNDKKVILNLKWLRYLNSKSIGYIADIFSNIEDRNSRMYISNCDDWVKDVLDLVGITTIVPTVDTLEKAISELK